MSRSVSYPTDAMVTYQRFNIDPDDETDSWIDYLEELQADAMKLWPSLEKCNKWLDREDHAMLENDLVYFGVSEYCGIVSIWIAAKEDRYPGLAYRWMERIQNTFYDHFRHLACIGHFSNGEAVYEERRKQWIGSERKS